MTDTDLFEPWQGRMDEVSDQHELAESRFALADHYDREARGAGQSAAIMAMVELVTIASGEFVGSVLIKGKEIPVDSGSLVLYIVFLSGLLLGGYFTRASLSQEDAYAKLAERTRVEAMKFSSEPDRLAAQIALEIERAYPIQDSSQSVDVAA